MKAFYALTQVFNRRIQVCRVSGIPVRINYSWFLVFALSVWLLASAFTGGFKDFAPVARTTAWFLSILTTFALFACVFGHELAHALAARLENIETEEIILHPFGGLARLSRAPESAGAEFRIAIAGPAASFLFALFAFGAVVVAQLGRQWTAMAVFFVIGAWNLLLAVFNLLPGYPLDGGRVLRAYLWRKTGSLEEATRMASLAGQAIGIIFIVFGIYVAFKWDDTLLGAWSALVGLFLRSAAADVLNEMRGGAAMIGRGRLRVVADAMSSPVAIEPETLVSHFINSILPISRQTAVAVAHDKRLHGILTLEDLKLVPRERWHLTKARDVMRPVTEKLFVESSASIEHAEKLMLENGAGAVGVLNRAGELVGFLQPQGLRRPLTKNKSTQPKQSA